jgi:hypothetical protein
MHKSKTQLSCNFSEQLCFYLLWHTKHCLNILFCFHSLILIFSLKFSLCFSFTYWWISFLYNLPRSLEDLLLVPSPWPPLQYVLLSGMCQVYSPFQNTCLPLWSGYGSEPEMMMKIGNLKLKLIITIVGIYQKLNVFQAFF